MTRHPYEALTHSFGVSKADGVRNRFECVLAVFRHAACRVYPQPLGSLGKRKSSGAAMKAGLELPRTQMLNVRTEHVLSAAKGLGAGTVDAYLGEIARHDIERAKWRLWHGRWKGCLIKLAGVSRWTEAKCVRDVEGVSALQRHLRDLLAYLEANQSALVNYGVRCRRGEPISTAFVKSVINEIIARRMIKKQQMR
jgi:hypothetical protein